MAGIISQRINRASPYDDVQGYNAAKVAMTDDDSVESRIARLSSAGSPIVQLNQTRARQEQQRMGTLNSSMNTEAVIKAGIETALPIASQDAATASNYKRFNQDADNTAYQFTAGEGNRARSQVEAGNQALMQIGASGKENRLTDESQGIIQSRLQKEGYDYDLGRIGKTGTESRLNIGASGVENRLTDEAQGLISSRIQKEGITGQGEQSRLNITAQGTVESRLIQERGQIDIQLQTADSDTRKALLERQGQIDNSLQDSAMDNQRYMQEREGQIQFNLGEARAANETTLQQLKGTQATALAKIETENSRILETVKAAGNMYSNNMLVIAEILADPATPDSGKQGLIDKQLQLLAVGMDSIKAITGQDIDVVIGIGGGGTGGEAVTDPNTGITTAPKSIGTPKAIPGSTWVKQPDGSWRSVSDTNPGGDNLTPTGPGGNTTPTPTIDSIMSNFSSGKVTQEQGVAQLIQVQAQSGMSDADLANYIGVDLGTWMSAKVGTTEVSR